jgi:DNA-binding NarL/FixJ family response regulator
MGGLSALSGDSTQLELVVLNLAVSGRSGGGRARRERGAEREEFRVLQAHYETLTLREREVFAHVAGKLNNRIAGEIGAAESTVKAHRARRDGEDASRLARGPGASRGSRLAP